MQQSAPLYLGIEIGGTKLQVAVGDGRSQKLTALERELVDRAAGAAGILRQLERMVPALLQCFPVEAVGIGFGGPVNAVTGCTVRSHQIAGWEDFPLSRWCSDLTGLPVVVANDCDCAALAESALGSGRGHDVVFYVTVGTGIGGGLILGGKPYAALHRRTPPPATCEIGHLRPGLEAIADGDTVESRASGLGMERRARQMLEATQDDPESVDARLDLLARCGSPDSLSARHLAEAALDGNAIALEVISDAVRTLGWAVAQVITLLAPDIVVVGGGVSMMPDSLFWKPLRDAAREYVFPPLRDRVRIEPAGLGETVVLHGALALARTAEAGNV